MIKLINKTILLSTITAFLFVSCSSTTKQEIIENIVPANLPEENVPKTDDMPGENIPQTDDIPEKNIPQPHATDNTDKQHTEPEINKVDKLSNNIVEPISDFTNMEFIPESDFLMGKSDSHDQHAGHEQHDQHKHHGHKNVDFGKPEHKVYLDSFYIDKFEITNAQFFNFMNAGGYTNEEYWTPDGWQWRLTNKITQPLWWLHENKELYKSGPDYPDHAVTGVSWYEAMAYAKWIGKLLPTEAQWEKAARGISGNRNYPWGNDAPDCSYANYSDEKYDFCEGSVSMVGKREKGKSPYGIYDMAGNVWEWCRDTYSAHYYSESPYKNPQGPSNEEQRILRGGSWVNMKDFISSTYRRSADPDLRDYFNGFRCVIEITNN